MHGKAIAFLNHRVDFSELLRLFVALVLIVQCAAECFIQVSPVHFVGFGSATDVSVYSSGCLVGVSRVALDDQLCHSEDGGYSYQCPVGERAELNDTPNCSSTPMVLAVDGKRLVLTLNSTWEGSLFRTAGATPQVIFRRTVISPDALATMVAFEWMQPQVAGLGTPMATVNGAELVALDGSLACSAASGACSATISLPMYGNSAWVNVSIVYRAPASGVRYHAVLHPRLRYAAYKVRRWGTSNSTPTLISTEVSFFPTLTRCLIDGNEGAQSLVELRSAADASGGEVQLRWTLLVVLDGQFPATPDPLTTTEVTLLHVESHERIVCNLLSVAVNRISCLAELVLGTANATSGETSLGVGVWVSGDEKEEASSPSPVSMISPRTAFASSEGWISIRNRTYALIALPPNTSITSPTKIHCMSASGVQLRSLPSGTLVCRRDPGALFFANDGAVPAVDITVDGFVQIEVDCCFGPRSNSSTGIVPDEDCREETCAISLEAPLHPASGESVQADDVAVIEIIGGPVAVPVTVTLSGRVYAVATPSIGSSSVCHSYHVTSLLPPLTLAARFQSLPSGVWDNATQTCHWFAALMHFNCSSGVDPFVVSPTSVSTSSTVLRLVFCGNRRSFADPLQWEQMELPATLWGNSTPTTVSATTGGEGTSAALPSDATAISLVPRVRVTGFPAAIPLAPRNTTLRYFYRANRSYESDDGFLACWSTPQAVVVNAGSSFTISAPLPSTSQLCRSGAAVDRVALVDAFSTKADGADMGDFFWVPFRFSCTNTSGAAAWTLNATAQGASSAAAFTGFSPSLLPAGYYRTVLFSAGRPAVTCPPTSVALNATSVHHFLLVAPLVNAPKTSPLVGALGGGLVTLTGAGLWPSSATTYRLRVVSTFANASVTCSAVNLDGTLQSWAVPDASRIAGVRTLNTISALWVLTATYASNITILNVSGPIGILQPAALPSLSTVSPLVFSALESAVLSITGSSLTLRTVSVCKVPGSNASAVPPFVERDTPSCEICTPMLHNDTHVRCALSTRMRRGFFAVYVSSTPDGGTAFPTPISFVLELQYTEPRLASPFGGAVVSVYGIGFIPGLQVQLVSAGLLVVPCAVTLDNASRTGPASIVCEVAAALDQNSSLPEDEEFQVMLVEPIHGFQTTCANRSLCTISFSSTGLPVLHKVTPKFGQASTVVTIFGARFTGNLTWLNDDASNIDFFIGTTRCQVILPIYFDRVRCYVKDYCSSALFPYVRARMSPYGFLNTASRANDLRFSCTMAVLSVTPSQGSTMGGQLVTISGYGFPESPSTDSSATPTAWIAGVPCSIVSHSNELITCLTGSVGSITDLVGSVVVSSVERPTVQSSCCSYTYAALLTPTVTSLAPTTGSEGVRVTIVGTGFQAGGGVQVELSGVLIERSVVLSSTSVNVLIPRLPPGSARMRLVVQGVGYAFHAATLDNFSYALTTTLIQPARFSYGSGSVLTILGTALGLNSATLTAQTKILSPVSTAVYICGQLCELTSLDFNKVTCSVPPFQDTRLLQQYPLLARFALVDSSLVTVYQRVIVATVAPVAYGRTAPVTKVFWDTVTERLLSASANDFAQTRATGAVAATETYLFACRKHSRLALESVAVLLFNVSDVTQNVTCTLRSALQELEVRKPLDPTIAGGDWAAASQWSAVPVWSSTRMLSGWTNLSVKSQFVSARYFLLTCENLVPGVTSVAAVRMRAAVVGIAPSGGQCPINIVVKSESTTFESCTDPTGTLCSQITYDSTMTPIVTAVDLPFVNWNSPTRLTLSGAGFGLSAAAISSLVIGGVACQPQLAEASSLVCVAQGPFAPKGLGNYIQLEGAGQGFFSMDQPFVAGEVWSSPLSWYASSIPELWSIVVIPEGTSIVLDHSPPVLTAIVVYGTLILQDVALSLTLSLLYVSPSGTVQGGNSGKPLSSLINITLCENPWIAPTTEGGLLSSPSALVLYKTIVVDGGHLHLFGTSNSILTTSLEESVTAGQQFVRVADRVDWPVGSTVLVTKVSAKYEESEMRVVVGKTLEGTTTILLLDAPLNYVHKTTSDRYLSQTWSLSAQVVLLARNVVIQGDAVSASNKWGASVVALNDARLQLSGILLTTCGRAEAAGRSGVSAVEISGLRPLYLASVLDKCALTLSFYRGITVVDSSLLAFTQNFVYSTRGHGFCALGGSATNLSLTSNWITASYDPNDSNGDGAPSLVSTLGAPIANYYLTHPSVFFQGNAASGSAGYGIWFDLLDDAHAPNSQCPFQQAVSSFNQTFISGATLDGLYISPSLVARQIPCTDTGLGTPSNAFALVQLTNLLVFSCNGNGIRISAIGSLTISGSLIADCGAAALLIGASLGTLTISSSLLSGLLSDGSSLVSTLGTGSPRVGIALLFGAENVVLTSVQFRLFNSTNSTALTTCKLTNDAASVSNRSALYFISASKIVMSAASVAVFARLCGTVLLFDSDGTFTQLQRQTYIVSGGKLSLGTTPGFTMCKSFNASDLSLGIANAILADRGSNTSLLLCDTSSTYAFFVVSVTLIGCVNCTAAMVNITHAGAVFGNVTFPLVADGESGSFDGGDVGNRTFDFIAVDGRPTTSTSIATVTSSRLVYEITPVCATTAAAAAATASGAAYDSSSSSASCAAGSYLLRRNGLVRLVFPMSLNLPVVPRTIVQRNWFVPLQSRVVGSYASLIPHDEGVEEIPSTLSSTAQTVQAYPNSSHTITVLLSTTTLTEGVLIRPDVCPPGNWCVPLGAYPGNSNSQSSSSSRTWLWSQWAQWTLDGLEPSSLSDVVVIPPGVTVLADVNVTGLQALVVSGVLDISTVHSGTSVTVECSILVVLGTLLLSAPDAALTATLVVLEPADLLEAAGNSTASSSSTPTVWCRDASSVLHLTRETSVSCGVAWVSGQLHIRGNSTPTWWASDVSYPESSRSMSAPQGHTLLNRTVVGLTSASADVADGEVNKLIQDVPAGTTAENATRWPWVRSQKLTTLPSGGTVRGETAVLSKSARLVCGRTDPLAEDVVEGPDIHATEVGCTMVIQHIVDPLPIAALSPVLVVQVHHASVARFGRSATPAERVLTAAKVGQISPLLHGAPALFVALDLSGGNFSMTHTVFFSTRGSAVYVHGNASSSSSVPVFDHLVTWGSLGTAFLSDGVSNVSSALFVGTKFPRSSANIAQDTILCSYLDSRGTSVVRSSVAAGSESEGFCLPWTGCYGTQSALVAHSCTIGVFLYHPFEGAAPCSVSPTSGQTLGGFVLYRNRLVGILSTQHTDLTLTSMLLAWNPIGAYLASGGAVNGTTTVSASAFSGYTSSEGKCAQQTCSSTSHAAFAGAVTVLRCFEDLFASEFYVTGIMLASQDLSNVPIDYARSGASPVALYTVIGTGTSPVYNVPSFVASGLSFSGFALCGYAFSLHPLAVTPTYPRMSATRITLELSAQAVFVPSSSLRRCSASPDGGVCRPSQTVIIVDSDGTVRGANSTAVIVAAQQAMTLLACSSSADVASLSVCPTTISFGVLFARNVDDDANFALGCVAATSHITSSLPTFYACAADQRGTGTLDPFVSILIAVGGLVRMTVTSGFLPRNLAFTLTQCASSAVVLQLQLQENDLRLSVWVNGVQRQLGSGVPGVTSRGGEWHRPTMYYGADQATDATNVATLAIPCGATVEMHHIVYGLLDVVVNATEDDITFGRREAIAKALAAFADRPAATVFVAYTSATEVSCDDVSTCQGTSQVKVSVRFEAEDGYPYSPRLEAVRVNAALGQLAALDLKNLSDEIGLAIFYRVVTLVPLAPEVVPASTSLLTLRNILVFSSCVAALVGVAVGSYWYLYGLRVASKRRTQRVYSGMVFGSTVDSLPDTEEIQVEETLEDTARSSRLRSYLEEWRLPYSHTLLTDAVFGSSIKSSESSESPATSPPLLAVPGPQRLAAAGAGSIVNAFLSVKSEELVRSRSPSTGFVYSPAEHTMVPVLRLDSGNDELQTASRRQEHHPPPMQLEISGHKRLTPKRGSSVFRASTSSISGADVGQAETQRSAAALEPFSGSVGSSTRRHSPRVSVLGSFKHRVQRSVDEGVLSPAAKSVLDGTLQVSQHGLGSIPALLSVKSEALSGTSSSDSSSERHPDDGRREAREVTRDRVPPWQLDSGPRNDAGLASPSEPRAAQPHFSLASDGVPAERPVADSAAANPLNRKTTKRGSFSFSRKGSIPGGTLEVDATSLQRTSSMFPVDDGSPSSACGTQGGSKPKSRFRRTSSSAMLSQTPGEGSRGTLQ